MFLFHPICMLDAAEGMILGPEGVLDTTSLRTWNLRCAFNRDHGSSLGRD